MQGFVLDLLGATTRHGVWKLWVVGLDNGMSDLEVVGVSKGGMGAEMGCMLLDLP